MCYLLNSVKQHADLIHNSVTALGCTSKHCKWEEAPANRYCLSSSSSKSLGADSAPAKRSRQWESTGREQTSLPWAGAVRAPRGTAGHGGERGAAYGHPHTGGLPGTRPSPRPWPRQCGMPGPQEPARWVWARRALPGTVVGLGRLMNPESHSALNIINALELLLWSHSLGLCNRVLDLTAFPRSLCFYTIPY